MRAKRDLGVVFDPGISVRALAGLVDQIAAERGAGVPSHGRNHAVLLGDLTILAKLNMLVHLDPAVRRINSRRNRSTSPSVSVRPPNMLRLETLHVERAVDRRNLFGRTIFRIEEIEIDLCDRCPRSGGRSICGKPCQDRSLVSNMT